MTDIRSVAVRLDAQVTGYVANMQHAGKVTRDTLSQVNAVAVSNRQAVRDLGTDAGKVGLVAAAGVGLAVKRFADFDSAMSAVKASTVDATKSAAEQETQLGKLREAALKAGADSQFSATEAAEGVTQLAKAGVSASDILGGGLTGSLDLAAAGQIAVGDAAEYTATALTQFGLQGSQASHVADLLAAGAGKAQGEVSDMALALNYAGVPAANLGVSIEQTAGSIALLAKNGVVGEKAGTTLRGMLSSLSSPSKIAATEMDKLGIKVFDAQGNFIGLDGVAGQLKGHMSGLTQEERAYSLGRIFGNEQLQGANILYREGAEGVRRMTKEVNDSNFAADQAATKTDNLKGDIERLGGALDSFLIGSAEGADGPLRDLTKGLTGFVDVANSVPDPLKSAAFYTLALVAAVGGLAFVGSRAITAVGGTKANIALLRTEASKAIPALSTMNKGMAFRGALRGGALIAGLAVAQSGLAEKTGLSNTASLALMGTIAGPAGAAIGAGVGVVKDLAAANNNLVDAMKAANDVAKDTPLDFAARQGALDALRKQILETQDVVRNPFGSVGNFIGSAGNLFTNTLDEARDKLHDTTMEAMALQHGLNELANSAGGEIRIGRSLTELGAIAGTVGPALEAAGLDIEDVLLRHQNWDVAVEAVRSYVREQDSLPGKTGRVVDSLAGMGNEMKTVAEKAKELEDALKSLLDPLLDQDEANVALQRSLRTLKKDLKGGADALDVNTKRGQDNRDAIRSRIDDLKASIVADAAAGVGQEKLAAKMKRGRDAILDAGIAAHISKGQMHDYLKELGFTPTLIRTLIKAETADASRKAKELKALLDQINDKTITITAAVLKAGPFGFLTGKPTATGGPITGPGTGTSDDVPIMASNGEHMWTTAEVDNAGGHAAMYRMRKLAAAGRLPQFRAGGQIMGPGYATGGAVASQSSVSGSPGAITALAAATRDLAAAERALAAAQGRETRSEAARDEAQAARETSKELRTQVATHGDLLRQQQQIRDIGRELHANERNAKGKLTGRKELRGLDRQIAEEELREARREMRQLKHSDEAYAASVKTRDRLAAKLAKTYGSAAQEAARVERAEKAKADAEEKRDAAKQARQEHRDAVAGTKDTLTGAGDIFGGGTSPAAAIRSVDLAVHDISQYGSTIAALKAAGASPALLAQVAARAESGDFRSAIRLGQALLAQPGLLAGLNASLASLGTVAGQTAAMVNDPRFYASTAWNPTGVAPKIVQVSLQADPTAWLNEVRRVITHEVQAMMQAGVS